MGTILWHMFLTGWLVVYFYAKLFAATDTDGELKKTASESFLSWLDRRLK